MALEIDPHAQPILLDGAATPQQKQRAKITSQAVTEVRDKIRKKSLAIVQGNHRQDTGSQVTALNTANHIANLVGQSIGHIILDAAQNLEILGMTRPEAIEGILNVTDATLDLVAAEMKVSSIAKTTRPKGDAA